MIGSHRLIGGVDVTLDELGSGSPAAIEEWHKIARDTSVYATTLFGLSDSPAGERLELAGSGTFVAHDGKYYVITAAHVWYTVLKRAKSVGLAFREDLQHSHFIETSNIEVSGPARNTPWGEWGPDIICLRIPDADVGTIKAFRSFTSFSISGDAVKCRVMEAYFLIGTPARLGVYSQNQASVQTVRSRVHPPAAHAENGFDYREVELQLEDRTVDSFGGISGGGLWKVRIYVDETTGKIDSEATLDGVAFWSHGVQNGFGVIRCHGPLSIQAALLS
jgi:hypothetical protein